MQLKEQLTSLRKECGLSQSEVAEALDVSRQAISKWESGVTVPSSENLIKLGKLYHVSVDVLVGYTDKAAEVPKETDAPEKELPSVPENGGRRRLSKTAKWMLCVVGALLLAILCYGFITRGDDQAVRLDEAEQVDVSDLGELEEFNFN